tara:strand:- start:4998 stop:5237 length:240 start_codon:yes stop_codon:yes gene_type:complete
MNELLPEILKIGGQAGVLWVALFYLSKTIKGQYETRIAALESANKQQELDKMALHARIEDILLRQIERWSKKMSDKECG